MNRRMIVLPCAAVAASLLVFGIYALTAGDGSDLKGLLLHHMRTEYGDAWLNAVDPATITVHESEQAIVPEAAPDVRHAGPFLRLDGVRIRFPEDMKGISVRTRGHTPGVDITIAADEVVLSGSWPDHIRSSLRAEPRTGPIMEALLAYGYSKEDAKASLENVTDKFGHMADEDLMKTILATRLADLQNASDDLEALKTSLLLDYRLLYGMTGRITRIDQDDGIRVYVTERAGRRDDEPAGWRIHAFADDGRSLAVLTCVVSPVAPDTHDVVVDLFTNAQGAH